VLNQKYVRNPDVVVREESPDGALLFNPDTNQIKLLNFTGVTIWKLCDGSHDLPALVGAIQGAYEQVPSQDEVSDQISKFIERLVEDQFLGFAEA
jgi:hypothetical protein